MNKQFVQRIRLAAHVVENPASLRELLAELCGASSETGDAPRLLHHDGGQGDQGSSSVSRDAGEQVIVISIGDLAELLQAVAKPPSLGEALIAEGFTPVSGPAPSLRRGNKRYPLKHKPEGVSAGIHGT